MQHRALTPAYHGAPAPSVASPSKLGHRIASSIGAVGATISGILVALLCASILIPVLFGFIALGFLPVSYGVPAGFALGALGGFFGNLPLARYNLRVFPPRVQGRPRYLLVAFYAAGFVYSVGAFLWSLLGAPDAAIASFGGGAGHESVPDALADQFAMFASPALYAGNAGFLIGYLSGLVVPFCLRQLHPRAFLDGPFVVFLRRFSTFSDREVLRKVLRAVPPGTPVAMLTATGSRAGDWNPFLIGFAGLKIRQPIRSMPIILRSTDADWREAADTMIARAKSIVMDLSEGSGAISEEIAMIEKHGRCADTVLLSRQSNTIDELVAKHPDYAASRRIEYRQSWLGAWSRFIVGGMLSSLLGLFVVLISALIVTIVGNLGAAAPAPALGLGPGGEVPISYDFGWSGILVGAAYLAVTGFVFVSFFLRPVLNRAAYRAIRDSLSVRNAA